MDDNKPMNLTKINTNLSEDINLVYIVLFPKIYDAVPFIGDTSIEACFLASDYKNIFMQSLGDAFHAKFDSKLIHYFKTELPTLLLEKVIQEYKLQETNNYIINIGTSRYNPDSEYWLEVLNEFENFKENNRIEEDEDEIALSQDDVFL